MSDDMMNLRTLVEMTLDADLLRCRGRANPMAQVADQLRPKLPKPAGFIDGAETDVLAYMTFPADRT